MRKSIVAGIAIAMIFSSHAYALTGSTFTSSSTVYVVNTFTSTENWTVPYGVSSIDAIAVGGGGGGGADGGNGGGGGELRVLTSQSVNAGDVLSATIGAGGSGNIWAGSAATSGGASYLKKGATTYLQANGGAAGTYWSNVQNYAAGGSGGSGGTGSNGGTGGVNRYQQNEGIGGTGSAGPATTIPTGSSVNYGGGGGGGSCWGSLYSSTVTGASGGAGGGGRGAGHTYGSGSPAGSNGTANTGGGGGGGSACDAGNSNGSNQRTSGGAGGTGVVVIRYILTAPTSLDLDSVSDSGISSTDNLTNDTTPTISGTAIGGSSVQLYVDGVSSGSACTANSSTGAWSCTAASLSVGAKSIVARATISGAVKDSSALSITIDATGPTLSPSSSISVAENQTSISTLSCNEACSLTLTSGADSASVTFATLTGVLVFNSAPDYEAPADSGSNNIYYLTFQGVDSAGNTSSLTLTITITNANESGTVNAPTVSGTIYKGVNTTITVTINVAGKVRFFVGGKRISTCKDRTTSGSYPNNLATCTWKPAVTGRQYLTATLTPTDNTFSASTSSRTEVFVVKRGTTR